MLSWFLQLLGVGKEITEHLQDASFAFQRPLMFWLGLGLIAPLGYFIYRRQQANLFTAPPLLRVTLTACRIAVLVILVMVLAHPYVKVDHEYEKRPIVAVLIVVAFVVGLAVIALTIYTSTVERVRDYGVLKAVGASPRQLFAVVVRQSVVVAVLGYALGTILAFVTGKAIQDAVPEFATIYRWQDLAAVFGAALVMSIIAAVVPIRRVASVDPAIVFRA